MHLTVVHFGVHLEYTKIEEGTRAKSESGEVTNVYTLEGHFGRKSFVPGINNRP